MGFTIKTKIEGVAPLLARLQGLKQSVQRSAIRKAVDAAGKEVQQAVAPLVPKDTGLLAKSMGRKVVAKAGRSTAVAIVGPRTGFKVFQTFQSVAKKGRSQIGYRTDKKGKTRKVILRLGSRSPVGANPAKYGHLAELGRKAVKPVNKKGLTIAGGVYASAAAAKGSHFMQRGLAAARGRIVTVMAKAIQAVLTKAGR